MMYDLHVAAAKVQGYKPQMLICTRVNDNPYCIRGFPSRWFLFFGGGGAGKGVC